MFSTVHIKVASLKEGKIDVNNFGPLLGFLPDAAEIK